MLEKYTKVLYARGKINRRINNWKSNRNK
jgi:hypothetical protein